MEQPDDLLQTVAVAMAGEDGCCCLWDIDGRCCMTDNARRVLEAIDDWHNTHAQHSAKRVNTKSETEDA